MFTIHGHGMSQHRIRSNDATVPMSQQLTDRLYHRYILFYGLVLDQLAAAEIAIENPLYKELVVSYVSPVAQSMDFDRALSDE
jgi:hypothetical protein